MSDAFKSTDIRRRDLLKLAGSSVLLSMLGGALVLTGCGGPSGSAASQPQSYNITITATSGTDVHTTTVTLQVQ